MHLHLKALLASIAAASLGSALAATYEQNFDALADGATDLGDGTVLLGNGNFTPSVVAGELQITANTNSNNSALHFPALADSSQGFSVTFDYRMDDPVGGNPPADGFAFSYGAIPFGTNSSQPEEGWPGVTDVLSFEVDTWMVGDTEVGPAIGLNRPGDVGAQGNSLHGSTLALTNGNIFADGESISGTVSISWQPGVGASFETTGATTNAAFEDVATPGFGGDDTWTFAIAARTGGANENLFIDNVVINTGAPDSDGDGLSDAYEVATGLDPDDDGTVGESAPGLRDGLNGADGDPDGDTLTNEEERDLGTLPLMADSDDDGLNDNVEDNGGVYVSAGQTGTNPRNPDTDGDGFEDGVENPTQPFVDADQPGTDPNNPNTDGDSLDDGDEIAFNRDPTVADDPAPGTSYVQNFDSFKNGATQFGDGSELVTNGNTTPQVIDGQLRLTENTNSNVVAFHIPAIANSSGGWTAKFDYSITDDSGNAPADGFAFSYGAIPVGELTTLPEEGWLNESPILSFEMDTWMNGDGEVGPAIAVDGVDAAFTNGDILPDGSPGAPATVSGQICIIVQADGTATYTSTGAITNADFVDIPTGFVLNDSFTFAIAARTGGANQEVLIDNLEILPGTGAPDLAIIDIVYTPDTGDGTAETTITWNSRSNQTYTVFASKGLAQAGEPLDLVWEELDDGVESEGDTTSFTESAIPAGTAMRFYRVEQQ